MPRTKAVTLHEFEDAGDRLAEESEFNQMTSPAGTLIESGGDDAYRPGPILAAWNDTFVVSERNVVVLGFESEASFSGR